ncbi:MAG TPA: molybdopterin-dependent oxidoreductase [Candidatus Dormibacteraeota bacterium]|nr:molybdopterin-dependent oxidoreductase [Candidatus Dormibacteraeota bacterium]
MAAVQTDQVTLTVNGQSVTVPKGTLILDAAKKVGIDIPIFCSHPKMAPVAVCRMCLVEVEKMPKLQPACAVYVSEGMAVKTTTEQVNKYQKGVLEFLLINHPLDCPICDKGGECPLQDQTYQYGPGASRYDFTKAHFDKSVPLSDKIVLDRERCILCWRCTRFSEEISGERELALIQRGVHTIIGTFNDEPAQSNYQGNWTEICPVGALTARQYRFVSRPWDLDRTASVCPGCSMGCNIQIDARSNRIGRFQSRENLAVDDSWLCDYGRYSFPNFQRKSQERPRVRRNGALEEVSFDEAIAFTADALKQAGGQVAGWASPADTNEEMFLFRRLFREVLQSPHLDHRSSAVADAEPDDMTLPIADIEGCDHVVVLGGQEVIDAAPVLHLRLFKSQRKGVNVLKVGAAEGKRALDGIPAEAQVVGILATEANKNAALDLQSKLAKKVKGSVRRLLVTVGPNGRGAKDLGILPHLGPGYASLNGQSGKGRVEWPGAGLKALYVHESSPLHGFTATDAESMWLPTIPLVVFHRFTVSPLDNLAHVILPGHAFTEKDGTVTNMEGRVQRIRKGIDAEWVWEDWRVLQGIANRLGAAWTYESVSGITSDLIRSLPPYGAAVNTADRVLWSEAK